MSRPNRDIPSPSPPEEAELSRRVAEAMTAMGWLAPVTEQDVALAEQRLARRADAPAARLDLPPGQGPDAPRRGPIPAPPPGWAGPDRSADLARAARNGQAIPPEVLQAMRRDRDRAEADAAGDAVAPHDDPAGDEPDPNSADGEPGEPESGADGLGR